MRTLEQMRADAEAHERELEAVAWFRTADLARRWHVSPRTIHDIPPAELPYLSVGRGGVREHRRYDPRDVAAYERRHKRTGAGVQGAA